MELQKQRGRRPARNEVDKTIGISSKIFNTKGYAVYSESETPTESWERICTNISVSGERQLQSLNFSEHFHILPQPIALVPKLESATTFAPTIH